MSVAELRQLAAAGDLAAGDLVWREGMPDWVTAASVGIGEAAPPPVPSKPATTATPPPAPVAARGSAQRASRRKRTQTAPHLVIGGIAVVVAVVICVAFVAYSMGRQARQDAIAQIPSGTPIGPIRSNKNRRESASSPDEPRARPSPETTSNLTSPVPDPKPTAVSPSAALEPNSEEKTTATDSTIDAFRSATSLPSNEPANLSPQTSEPATPPKPPVRPQEPVAQTKPYKLFQYVDIKRNPSFNIQGLTTSQNIHYQVVSELTIDPAADDKTVSVTQVVEETRLVAADDLSRGTFEKSLAAMKRQQYTYKLNERGAVIEFTGHKKNLASLPAELAAGSGFLVTSVIDKDGWKELAELTFLVPDLQAQTGELWERQMTHDWGELGGWYGTTTFGWGESNSDLRVIGFRHDMQYRKAEASSGGGLPFKISDAVFTPQEAGGSIRYDPVKKRVTAAQEVFHVTGNVTAELLGQKVPLQVTERQLIEIMISDQRVATQ